MGPRCKVLFIANRRNKRRYNVSAWGVPGLLEVPSSGIPRLKWVLRRLTRTVRLPPSDYLLQDIPISAIFTIINVVKCMAREHTYLEGMWLGR